MHRYFEIHWNRGNSHEEYVVSQCIERYVYNVVITRRKEDLRVENCKISTWFSSENIYVLVFNHFSVALRSMESIEKHFFSLHFNSHVSSWSFFFVICLFGCWVLSNMFENIEILTFSFSLYVDRLSCDKWRLNACFMSVIEDYEDLYLMHANKLKKSSYRFFFSVSRFLLDFSQLCSMLCAVKRLS